MRRTIFFQIKSQRDCKRAIFITCFPTRRIQFVQIYNRDHDLLNKSMVTKTWYIYKKKNKIGKLSLHKRVREWDKRVSIFLDSSNDAFDLYSLAFLLFFTSVSPCVPLLFVFLAILSISFVILPATHPLSFLPRILFCPLLSLLRYFKCCTTRDYNEYTWNTWFPSPFFYKEKEKYCEVFIFRKSCEKLIENGEEEKRFVPT